MDPASITSDANKRQVLAHGVQTTVFRNYIMSAPATKTYEELSKLFQDWCIKNSKLDENAGQGGGQYAGHVDELGAAVQIPGTVDANAAIAAFVRKFFPFGSCYNCGSPDHQSDKCAALQCGGCGNTYLSTSAPGWHVSKDCPFVTPKKKLNAKKQVPNKKQVAKAAKIAKAELKAKASAQSDAAQQKNAIKAMAAVAARFDALDERLKAKNI